MLRIRHGGLGCRRWLFYLEEVAGSCSPSNSDSPGANFDWNSDFFFPSSTGTLSLHQMPLNVYGLGNHGSRKFLIDVSATSPSDADLSSLALRKFPKPRYQSMSGYLLKERRGCLLTLQRPRYRTISHQNVHDDSSELQANKGYCAEPKDTKHAFKIEIGDAYDLRRRINYELASIESKVLNFKNKYKKNLRPMLASRGLILPNDLIHPSTLFIHKQTYKILNFNPSYLSSFDVMTFENGVKDKEEWCFFLQHLVDRRVYVVEDWDSSFSTIETLMYDHGLKEPDDGSEIDFYKGECDVSYKDAVACLSLIIWKGDRIICSAFTKISSVEMQQKERSMLLSHFFQKPVQ